MLSVYRHHIDPEDRRRRAIAVLSSSLCRAGNSSRHCANFPSRFAAQHLALLLRRFEPYAPVLHPVTTKQNVR